MPDLKVFQTEEVYRLKHFHLCLGYYSMYKLKEAYTNPIKSIPRFMLHTKCIVLWRLTHTPSVSLLQSQTVCEVIKGHLPNHSQWATPPFYPQASSTTDRWPSSTNELQLSQFEKIPKLFKAICQNHIIASECTSLHWINLVRVWPLCFGPMFSKGVLSLPFFILGLYFTWGVVNNNNFLCITNVAKTRWEVVVKMY